MDSTEKEISVGFYNDVGTYTVYAKQYDTHRKIKFLLVDGISDYSALDTTYIYFREKFSDGVILPPMLVSKDSLSEDGTELTLQLTPSMLKTPGIATCEIVFVQVDTPPTFSIEEGSTENSEQQENEESNTPGLDSNGVLVVNDTTTVLTSQTFFLYIEPMAHTGGTISEVDQLAISELLPLVIAAQDLSMISEAYQENEEKREENEINRQNSFAQILEQWNEIITISLGGLYSLAYDPESGKLDLKRGTAVVSSVTIGSSQGNGMPLSPVRKYKYAEGDPAGFSNGSEDEEFGSLVIQIQVKQDDLNVPIEGYDEIVISRYGVDEDDHLVTKTIDIGSFAGTVYGGSLDYKTGVLTVTHGNIASYNGETLPGAWISTLDIYDENTTPTTGAQVVYELETPVIYQIPTTKPCVIGSTLYIPDPKEITTLVGINNVSANCGPVSLTYPVYGFTSDSGIILIDETTHEPYVVGIDNGKMFIKNSNENEEEWGEIPG